MARRMILTLWLMTIVAGLRTEASDASTNTQANAERLWFGANGNKVQASFVSCSNDGLSVVLRLHDGRIKTTPLTSFCRDDQILLVQLYGLEKDNTKWISHYQAMSDDGSSAILELNDGVKRLIPLSLFPDDVQHSLAKSYDLTLHDGQWKKNSYTISTERSEDSSNTRYSEQAIATTLAKAPRNDSESQQQDEAKAEEQRQKQLEAIRDAWMNGKVKTIGDNGSSYWTSTTERQAEFYRTTRETFGASGRGTSAGGYQGMMRGLDGLDPAYRKKTYGY